MIFTCYHLEAKNSSYAKPIVGNNPPRIWDDSEIIYHTYPRLYTGLFQLLLFIPFSNCYMPENLVHESNLLSQTNKN